MKSQESELIALNVIAVPQQAFLETGDQFIKDSQPIFEKAISRGKQFGVSVAKKIVVSHNISEAILDVARSGKTNLILMGGTEKQFRGKIKLSVPQIVMGSADCDVGILFPKNFRTVRRILMPLGPGEHEYRVRFAEKLMKFFNAQMTIFTVVKDRSSIPDVQKEHDKTMKSLGIPVKCEIEVADSIPDAVSRKSKDYDLILIGPSTEWILHDVLFGSVPDSIINKSACSVLILKEPEQHAESMVGMVFDKIKKRIN